MLQNKAVFISEWNPWWRNPPADVTRMPISVRKTGFWRKNNNLAWLLQYDRHVRRWCRAGTKKGAKMLLPLFDKDCDLVAWIDPGKSVFDLDMNWVAYVANNNLWSAKTNEWLGPISGLLCFDTRGKPVLWNPKERVRTVSAPARPLRLTPSWGASSKRRSGEERLRGSTEVFSSLKGSSAEKTRAVSRST